ncbi:hypothetical protein ACFYPX_09350 [Micromonospora zamorensis]|uniref:hypothetical protein n=1 Tax=Micromonospora zamorensis TaxID=709883 RepID=UPI0036C4BC54
MRRGLRSTRLLTGHRTPAGAQPASRPGGPGVGPQTWAALNMQPSQRAVGRARVGPSQAQRRTLTRRVWAWRLLLSGWFTLTALTLWAAVGWAGLAGLGCPALMLCPLLLLAWCAVVDLRDREAEMRNGR